MIRFKYFLYLFHILIHYYLLLVIIRQQESYLMRTKMKRSNRLKLFVRKFGEIPVSFHSVVDRFKDDRSLSFIKAHVYVLLKHFIYDYIKLFIYFLFIFVFILLHFMDIFHWLHIEQSTNSVLPISFRISFFDVTNLVVCYMFDLYVMI